MINSTGLQSCYKSCLIFRTLPTSLEACIQANKESVLSLRRKTASGRAVSSKYFINYFLLRYHISFDMCIRLKLNHRLILAHGIIDVSNMVKIHQIPTQKLKISRKQNFGGPAPPNLGVIGSGGRYIYVYMYYIYIYIYIYIYHTHIYTQYFV